MMWELLTKKFPYDGFKTSEVMRDVPEGLVADLLLDLNLQIKAFFCNYTTKCKIVNTKKLERSFRLERKFRAAN